MKHENCVTIWSPGDTKKVFTVISGSHSRKIQLALKKLNENNLTQLPFQLPGKSMVGTLDTLKRSVQVGHTCLFSCQPNFTSGCFLDTITNRVIQPDYHIVHICSYAIQCRCEPNQ